MFFRVAVASGFPDEKDNNMLFFFQFRVKLPPKRPAKVQKDK